MGFYIYKMKGINYVGSTNNIKKRCWKHKNACWDENKRAYNYPLYQHIRKKNIDIELEILGVYKRKCSKRIKLLVEKYYINKYDSINNGLNNVKAFVNRKKYEKKWREENKDKIKKYDKEYREENKDKRKKYAKKYDKEYREKNKEKISQKGKVKIKCPKCNCLIRKDGLKTHQKTKKCKTICLKVSNIFISKI